MFLSLYQQQYDYNSSTIRKRIFQEALVQITLPTLQKALASVCKPVRDGLLQNLLLLPMKFK